MGRVQDKVALITGGASGIGKATAQAMVREGAKVVISDMQDEAGERTAAVLRESGGEALYLHHDVTDEAAWESVIAAVVERFGRLDVLVNNAGVTGGGKPVDEMTLEDWRGCMAVNLDGVFLGVKHGIRAMREGGGSIVNTSSILGLVGLPMAANYSASKGGVRLLTKAAAIECAARGIKVRINSVHPGFIDTPMVAGSIQRRGPQMREMIEQLQPYGAMGEPSDIAEGILHLASDAAKFMTGSELVIDGGYVAR